MRQLRPSVRLSTLGAELTAGAAHRQIDPRALQRAVLVWGEAGAEVRRIAASPRPITAVAAHAGTRAIACGGGDGRIAVWDEEGSLRAECPGTTAVTAIGYTPEGATLGSATADGVVTVRPADMLPRSAPCRA